MKHLFTVFSIILLTGVAYSAENQSANAGAFLERGVGARAHALGGAFTGLSNDTNAILYNSAGLANIRNIKIDSMYTKAFGEVEQSFFGGVMPLGTSGTLGAAYFSTGVEGIKLTTWDGFRPTDTGTTFGYGATALMLAYGNHISNDIALGANLKLINEKLYNANSSGIGLDFGLLYTPIRDLNVGVNIQNVNVPAIKWSTGYIEKMPLKSTLGVSAKFFDFTFLSDLTLRANRNMGYGLGLEYNYQDLLFIRGGINNGALTCGAGLNYDIFSLNYAFNGSPDEVLENNNTFSFGLNFNTVVAQAAPDYTPLKSKLDTVKLDILNSTVIKPTGTNVEFNDMAGSWGKITVEDMASIGLVNGRPNGNFDPNGVIKKVEATKIVLYAYKVKQQAGHAEVAVRINTDVKEPTPVRVDIYNEFGVLVRSIPASLATADKEKKLAWDGTDNQGCVVADGVYRVRVVVEKPFEEIDSEKELHVTSRFIDVEAPEKVDTTFSDVKSKYWASGIIDEAVQMGIISGESDTKFAPSKNFSKLDLVVSIAKALRSEGYKSDPSVELTYVDVDKIPQSELELVKLYVSVLGAGGDQRGALNPDKNLSRVEAAAILERYLATKKVFNSKLFHKVAADNATNTSVTAVVSEDDIRLSVYNVGANKVVFKGLAKGLKSMTVGEKILKLNAGNANVNTGLTLKQGDELPVQIVYKNGDVIDMIITYLKGKAILKGVSAKAVMKVNNKVVQIKPDGKFFTKFNTNNKNNLLMQVRIKNSASSLAEN